MKKINYVQPATTVVSVEPHAHILNNVSPVSKVESNAEINYGGGNSGAARTKDAGYDVWDDDWSKNQ